jgi:ferredoxin
MVHNVVARQSRVAVVCLAGMDVGLCTEKTGLQLSDRDKLVDLVAGIWASKPQTPVLLVSPSFTGFESFLGELSSLGFNYFLVDITGVPESILSGLPLERLVEYFLGLLEASLSDRRRAKRASPIVSRRELLRRLFLLPPRHVVVPEPAGSEPCDGGVCPYNALDRGRVREEKCRGCMLCVWECPSAFKPLHWTGIPGLIQAYSYIDKHGLDGILFICHNNLGVLDSIAAEASPARLLPFHVPCVSWLSPQMLEELSSLGVYIHVFYDEDRCRQCSLRLAAEKASSKLRGRGVVVGSSLVQAGGAAFTGYMRPRRSLEEVVRLLSTSVTLRRQG